MVCICEDNGMESWRKPYFMGNLNDVHERIIALRKAIIADGIDNRVPFVENDLRYIEKRLCSEGISFVKVTLPLLGRALDNGLVTGRITTPSNFSTRAESSLPMLFYGTFRKIFLDNGELIPDADENSIRYLRQVLLLDSKFVSEPTETQRKSSVAAFCSRMFDNRKIILPKDSYVLEEASRLLGKYLAKCDLTSIEPGQGPGAVAERFARDEKWDFTSWSSRAEKYYPYGTYGISNPLASLTRGVGVQLTNVDTRCILVPKDFRGPRLISAEGVVNQYLQQGQMKAIMSYIEKHPILSRSIRLRDQSHNQRMARDAYANDQVTLDLSDASDRISLPLFWRLFSRLPRLRRLLLCTRSTHTTYENSRIRITAFAPMGSAVCFPIETLIFWAITMASVKLVSLHPSTLKSTQSDRVIASSIAVFGDDIIAPSRCLDVLTTSLISFGCIPNMSKTCSRTPFRESCGSEWYNGSDVTIERNRHYTYAATSISMFPVLLSLQRRFFIRGMYRTAEALLGYARGLYPCAVLPLRVTLRDEDYASSSYTPQSSRIDTSSVGIIIPTLDFFSRQRLRIDEFNCAYGFYLSHRGVPIRHNQALQRAEFRSLNYISVDKEWLSQGYPRLLARLLGDSTERLTVRDREVRKVWSVFPISPNLFSVDIE